MKVYILLFLILTQIVIVISLVGTILNKSKVSRITSINYFTKKDIIAVSYGGLKYFYEHKPNIKRLEPEYRNIQTINSDSLNERYEYPINKPGNTIRIITLGDSFTYGAHVNTENNWPEKLEDMLKAYSQLCSVSMSFEVINLGMWAYDISYSAQRYYLRGSKYNPDIIIWLLLDPLRDTEKIREMGRALQMKSKNLESEKDWVEMAHKIYSSNFKNSKVLEQRQIDVTNKFVSTLKKQKLVFVSFPMDSNFYKDSIFDKLDQPIRNDLLVLSDLFSKGETYLFKDSHPNEKGHQIIAEDVYNYLVSKKLIPCTK